MAYTQSDIDNLRRKIASGVAATRHGDTSVNNQTLKEMRETLAIMEAEVNGTGIRRTLATFRSGA